MKVSSDKENITEGDIVPIDKLFYDIDDACRNNVHNTLKSILDSIELPQLKKQAFNRIIAYYESQALFPAGYSLLFIKYLLQNNELTVAMEQILKAREKGVDEKRISQLVYEHLIKPNELFYRETFRKNLEILHGNGVLISTMEFDFEQIKHNVIIILDCQDNSFSASLFEQKKASFFLPDVTNMKMIGDMLK